MNHENNSLDQWKHVKDKHKALCEEYARTGNISRAAELLQMDRSNCGVLLKKPELMAYTAWYKERIELGAVMTREEVGQELRTLYLLAKEKSDFKTATLLLGRITTLYGYDEPKRAEIKQESTVQNAAPQLPPKDERRGWTDEQYKEHYEAFIGAQKH